MILRITTYSVVNINRNCVVGTTEYLVYNINSLVSIVIVGQQYVHAVPGVRYA